MASSKQTRYRRPLFVFIILLAIFLVGTVIVLSSVTWFFGVPNWSLLSERDVPYAPGEVWKGLDRSNDGNASWAADNWSGHVQLTEDWTRLEHIKPLEGERIPRIIHQTWMNDELPLKWRDVYKECRRGLPNYTYHLWTDSASRAFIVAHYPSFLATFDSYQYPIQRADAIRYFVLYHFGGIYMDLDVGCKRDLGPLLKGDWDVVLAKTIPVGVSNDIMLSSKRSAFMEMTIHGLITFNHDYITNYPTVMFSTGPMFLSAQYSLYTSSHPLSPVNPTLEIRVMPKSLYGKNASPEEAPHAFFSHFYGSSWHADDSGFIIFLGRRGKWLMRLGVLVVTLGSIWLIWMRGRGAVRKSSGGLRRLVFSLGDTAAGMAGPAAAGGTYQLLSFLPSSSSSDTSSAHTSPLTSPTVPLPSPLLPFSLDMSTPSSTAHSAGLGSRPSSPTPSSAIAHAFRRAANTYSIPAIFFSTVSSTSSPSALGSRRPSFQGLPTVASSASYPGSYSSRRTQPKRGVLFFLPAFLTPVQQSQSPSPYSSVPSSSTSSSAATPRTSMQTSYHQQSTLHDLADGNNSSSSTATITTESAHFLVPPLSEKQEPGELIRGKTPPPSYERTDTRPLGSREKAVTKRVDDEWDDWAEEDEDRTP
ncbi:Glycosyltransferase, DXD sugar-binding motif [Phaffia rhodozyma]|uniref:Glycosyltransferase, DXD sugar-binding motif n=1 Tax=Phaffia rhodozyma TaxID=264483 RepID=A0A0F7SXJ2_PHARH|nr:Glycosyltransferase, DXD sugar-binding motif [Phaffia rhodozyma]